MKRWVNNFVFVWTGGRRSSRAQRSQYKVLFQVQFGHAGSCANASAETADAKNKALKDAGAVVPCSFDELGDAIRSVSHFKKVSPWLCSLYAKI